MVSPVHFPGSRDVHWGASMWCTYIINTMYDGAWHGLSAWTCLICLVLNPVAELSSLWDCVQTTSGQPYYILEALKRHAGQPLSGPTTAMLNTQCSAQCRPCTSSPPSPNHRTSTFSARFRCTSPEHVDPTFCTGAQQNQVATQVQYRFMYPLLSRAPTASKAGQEMGESAFGGGRGGCSLPPCSLLPAKTR